MRFPYAILLCLLVQFGLFGRLAAQGGCCTEVIVEHSHVDCHGHHDGSDHSHVPCDDHETPDGQNCPTDCGEHHHGLCVHSMQLSLTAENHCRLIPPSSQTMGCDLLHMRVPDGPVFEMDKPPLI